MSGRQLFIILATVIGFFVLARSLAQMLLPTVKEKSPVFEYFAKPTTVLGFKDAPEGTQVTFDGSLYTGAAELCFFVGDDFQPINARVKRLRDGWMPIVEFTVKKDGIAYSFTMFAATLDGTPESNLINFVRIRVRNESEDERPAVLAAAVRYSGLDRRVVGMRQMPFNPHWTYAFEENAILRDGHVLLFFTTDLPSEKRATLEAPYTNPFTGDEHFILEDTPVCPVVFRKSLEPGAQAQIDFEFPYFPVERREARGGRREMSFRLFDEQLERIERFWRELRGRMVKLEIPESKVEETFYASLVYNLIARDKVGDEFIQKVNEFQYDGFWLRDAAYMVRAYDVAGLHDVAEQCLRHFLRYQQPDGNFLSQRGQLDGWGQALFAFGQHYTLTRDKKFARHVLPAVRKAVQWLKQARLKDPLHLMPETNARDNERIQGHYTGHNLWALCGLHHAIALAKAAGERREAEEWQREYDDYLKTFLARLEEETAKTGGYLPPGLEGEGGFDWDNAAPLYPYHRIIEPFDPKVTATLKRVRTEKFKEGLMTYGKALHCYLTLRILQTHLVRGEQEEVVRGLYDVLTHTSSTHAGCEMCDANTRDYGSNFPPHGWFAAECVLLLRNMLVREDGEELHLFSALSPFWVQPAKEVAIENAPTAFGKLSAWWRSFERGASVRIEPDFHTPPKALTVWLPWFVQVKRVEADGKEVALERIGGSSSPARVRISQDVRQVDVEWDLMPDELLSYEAAVKAFKRSYHTLTPSPSPTGREERGEGHVMDVEPPPLMPRSQRERIFKERFRSDNKEGGEKDE